MTTSDIKWCHNQNCIFTYILHNAVQFVTLHFYLHKTAFQQPGSRRLKSPHELIKINDPRSPEGSV